MPDEKSDQNADAKPPIDNVSEQADSDRNQELLARDEKSQPGPAAKKGTSPSTKSKSPKSPWKLQLALLCGMLLLALIGMGLNRSFWEYWMIVVLVYGGVGIWRSTAQAKKSDRPYVGVSIRQAVHWGILLVFMALLAWLEHSDSESKTMTRDVASQASLVLLALTCCLAGIHFEWLFLVVGTVLTVMFVALQTVDRPFWLWAIMIIVAVIGIGLFYWLARSAPTTERHDEATASP